MDLRDRDRWLLWRYEDRDGRRTKVPYNAVTGGRGSATDPATWSSFEVALTACRGGYAGLGFALGGGLVGIDLDHCRDPQTSDLRPWARWIIAMLDSYAETSPSGTGVHIWARGALPPGPRKVGAVEMYDAGRYFTVTGNRLPNTPAAVHDRADRLQMVHAVVQRGHLNVIDNEFLQLWRGDYQPVLEARETRDRSHSAADLALCVRLVRLVGRDAELVDRLVRCSGLYRPKWDRPDYASRTITRALIADRDATADGRVEVDIAPYDLLTLVPTLWDAVVARNAERPHLFRHGTSFVRLGWDHEGRPLLRPVTVAGLRRDLVEACYFHRKVFARDGSCRKVPLLPPGAVIEDMLEHVDERIPVLNRVVRVPVFAPDGSLDTTPGYHPNGQVYYAPPSGLEIPDVADHPTDGDIARARSLLEHDLLVDFPFKGPADRAHAVALLLLPFLRDMIAGPTPLHVIEAPTPGSGKGLLADALLWPALGEPVDVLTEARNEEEWRKRLTAKLRESPAVVLLDNLRNVLDATSLQAILTARTWEDRLLGRNETVHLPVRCAWVATANNLSVDLDMSRRILPCRLNPTTDEPWNRDPSSFKHGDLREWATAHRGDLIWAALTLARAGLARGRPPARLLGSFEQWSRVLGTVLDGVGIPGFLQNLPEFYDRADTERSAWRAFTELWWETFEDRDVTTGDLFGLLQGETAQSRGIEINLKGNTDRGQRTAWGAKLAKQRDRIIGRYQVAGVGKAGNAQVWRLVPVQGE